MNNKNLSFALDGQVALVTGAAKGIGRACAIALAHAGADLILGLRDKETGGDLVQEIESLNRSVLPVQMDVSKLPEIESAVQATVSHFDRIDILVNNAGLALPIRPNR